MNKIFLLLLLLVACGVQAQIGGSPTGFNYGIKLPNATNEGDTLTVNSKIPIMNNDQVVNYFANVSDILAMGMSGLTPNRALISDGSGDLAVSAVTTTELSYVSGVTSALQTQLDAKLNSSSYTAADVFSKVLSLDGSGSGLDADLLRGVHWGNVNTNILTSGSLTGSDLTLTGGANVLKLNGSGSGTSNTAFISFYESDGTTRQGYMGYGDGTNSHLYIRNEVSGDILLLRSTGVLTYSDSAEFTGTVTATNFILSSDKRLKENFKDLGNGYYSFNFKGSKEKRYGVIAQEVKKYAPELVSEGEDGYLKVAYIDLLIKKIAELEARVKQLEKK